MSCESQFAEIIFQTRSRQMMSEQQKKGQGKTNEE